MTTNLPATISTLKQQITALDPKLRPADAVMISRAIERLMSMGMTFSGSMDEDIALENYQMALARVPAIGLQLAIGGIIRGEYDINRGFIPNPAELASLARSAARNTIDERVRLKDQLRTIEDTKPSTEEQARQKARIRELYAQFKSGTYRKA